MFNRIGYAYKPLSSVVLGFAPQGMVVVWFQYGYVSVQIGEYRAERIVDDSAYARRLFSRISATREEIRASRFDPEASPQRWQAYQTRYRWTPRFVLPPGATRLYRAQIEYFNGEREMLLRPGWSSPPPSPVPFRRRSPSSGALPGATCCRAQPPSTGRPSTRPSGWRARPGRLEMRFSEEEQSVALQIDGRPVPVRTWEAGRSAQTFRD